MREIILIAVFAVSGTVVCLSAVILIIGLLLFLGPLFFVLVTPLAVYGLWWAYKSEIDEIDRHYAKRRWWDRP